MDAIRKPAEKDLKQKVIFNAEQLRVARDWAYAKVSPTRPDGGKIDFSKTKFKKQIDFGAFDPQGEALLFRETNGDWTVIEWGLRHDRCPRRNWLSKTEGFRNRCCRRPHPADRSSSPYHCATGERLSRQVRVDDAGRS